MQLGVSSGQSTGRIEVLHVDDDPSLGELAAAFLHEIAPELDVTAVTSGEDALDAIEGNEFDCVVSDYDMPDLSGLDLLARVRDQHPDLPFILFTGKGSEEIASQAIQAGVTDYLQKSRGIDQFTVLANRVINAVSKYRAEATLEERARQQGALATLARLAITGVPEERLLQTTAEDVTHALGVDGVLCCSLGEGASFTVEAFGGDALVGIGERFPTGKRSQAGFTLLACEPVVSHPDESRFTDDALAGVVSSASVLVGDPDEPWGVLIAGSYTYRPFTPDDVFFLQSVGDLLATALAAGDKRAPPIETESDLQALVSLTDAMTGPGSFADRLAAALELGCSYLDVRFGFLTNISEETQTVIRAAGDHELLQPGEYGPITESYCRKVVARGEPLAVHDAVTAGWVEDQAYEVFGLGCYLGEKVVFREDTYGTVCFADRDPRPSPFSTSERAFVGCLADWVSLELAVLAERTTADGETAALDTIAWALDETADDALTVLEGALALDGGAATPAERALARLDALTESLVALARYSRPAPASKRVALERVAREAWATVGAAADRLTADAVEVRGDESRLRTLLEVAFEAVIAADADGTVALEGTPTGFQLRADAPAFSEAAFAFDADQGLWPVRAIATAHGYVVTATDATLTFTSAAIDSLSGAKANHLSE